MVFPEESIGRGRRCGGGWRSGGLFNVAEDLRGRTCPRLPHINLRRCGLRRSPLGVPVRCRNIDPREAVINNECEWQRVTTLFLRSPCRPRRKARRPTLCLSAIVFSRQHSSTILRLEIQNYPCHQSQEYFGQLIR